MLISGILFFYRLGALSLFDVDEPRYAETARNMLDTNDWVTPKFNGNIRYDKPVLFYWLIAIAYKVFGVTEFAARFWSAVFAVSLTLFIFLMVRKYHGNRSAFFSSLIFATSAQIIILSRASITDMTFNFFISSSLFSFYLIYTGSKEFKKYLYIPFYVSMGLGILTKGPAAIVIPFLAIIFFSLINKNLRSTLSELMLLRGLLIIAVIVLPWNLAMFTLHGGEFLRETIIKHNLIRFVGVVSEHRGSFFYYIPVILIGFFPWSIFLPSAISVIIEYAREPLLRKNELLSLRFFSLVWFLVVFFFFAISKTKLPTYVTPLYPPMAILVGTLFENILLEKKRLFKFLNLSVCSLITAFILMSACVLLFPSFVNKFKSESTSSFFNSPIDLNYIPWVISAILIGGVIFFSVSWFTDRRNLSLCILVATMFFFYLTCITMVAPEIEKYRQDSLRKLSELAGNRLKENDKLIAYRFNKPSIVFYSRHTVEKIDKEDTEKLYNYLNSEFSTYVITKKSFIDTFSGHTKFYIIKNDGEYVLISNRQKVK